MKFKVFTLIIMLSLNSWSASGETPHTFETDYCTSFPEGTKDQPDLWAHCCLEHDLYFWAGGTKEDRDQVDLGLKECVEATGEIQIAKLMYLGVTLGQLSPIKFETRKWGNSWGEDRKYEALTQNEVDQLEDKILESQIVPETILKNFINNIRSRVE